MLPIIVLTMIMIIYNRGIIRIAVKKEKKKKKKKTHRKSVV
jgi:hypothetical protein